MSEEKSLPSQKKLLEKSPMSGIAVPIAIILIGALIIFGVTKMLSSGKNHRDLVEELNSKTFGNRWVAAYELSKYLASSKIPPQDIPWVVENLIQVYEQSQDARTRNFVVLALGALKSPESYALIQKAVNDEDSQVQFNAVVAMGNLPDEIKPDWKAIDELLAKSNDEGLKQAILILVAVKKHPEGENILNPYLESSQRMLRYSAGLAMIYFNPSKAQPVLKEIMSLGYTNQTPGELNGAQVEALKYNLLVHIQKNSSRELLPLVRDAAENDSNIQISTKAQEIVNLLKN